MYAFCMTEKVEEYRNFTLPNKVLRLLVKNDSDCEKLGAVLCTFSC